jgi:hypothetical protein
VKPEKRAKHDLSEQSNERREHWKKFVPEANRVIEIDEERKLKNSERDGARREGSRKAEKETRKVEVAE